MGDPWGTESLSNTEYSLKGFEDNFVTENRLPDSVQYLENLGTTLIYFKCVFNSCKTSKNSVFSI